MIHIIEQLVQKLKDVILENGSLLRMQEEYNSEAKRVLTLAKKANSDLTTALNDRDTLSGALEEADARLAKMVKPITYLKLYNDVVYTVGMREVDSITIHAKGFLVKGDKFATADVRFTDVKEACS